MQHSKTISGIDIGTSKITTIIGQYQETEDKFNIIAVSSIPALGFRKGQIINIEQASNTITQSIESAERMAGFQINSAVVSISAPHIESVNSHGVIAISNQNNEINQEDIDRAIEAAKAISVPPGKEIIHIIPTKYTVDGQEGIIDPIAMNGVRLEVEAHIILASSPSLKNLKKCLEDIGIKIDSLAFSGLTAAKATLTETEKELGVALVDIGGSITTIIIFNEGAPIYSSVIPVGANNVTNDLAIGLRFSLENAEKIKTKLGKIMKNKDFQDEIEISKFGIETEDKNRKLSIQTATNGIIKPRLEEIFHLVYSQIKEAKLNHIIPAGIVLTGGGAQTVNVKEICEKVIPLPFRTASPPKIGGIVDDILNPAYTSTIGLLMFSRENNPNFSSGKKRSKISFGGLAGKLKKLIDPILP
jgi:cell division protein FtsA